MKLVQIYAEGRDIKDSEIPDEWRESWNKFIMGQTCMIETNEEGVRETVYYSHDFRKWYHMNQTAIERDSRINDILD
ncbi:hypothetical protein EBU71_20115 [bacterium]|nr:hypothetical protein [Candidatus Elulimicrobium humile]